MSWVGLRERNEFLHGFYRQRWRHDHQVGESHHPGDRGRIANEVERQLLIERCTYGAVGGGKQQRVAVCLRIDDSLNGQVNAEEASPEAQLLINFGNFLHGLVGLGFGLGLVG